ncbi:MAG: threonine ammonia-lyase [Gemmatimonadales bacterium]
MTSEPADRPLEPPSLAAVRAARDRIAGIAIRSPLAVLDAGPSDGVSVKLENLQPIGSFKIRGAASAATALSPAARSNGLATASAGNMAQGVAWCARAFGVPARVLVPDTAPAAKLDPLHRLGAEIIPVPFDEWWQTMADRGHPRLSGTFIHPFADPDVLAGNGTIALEIFEDAPQIDAILVPWGGGGLACGIAAAARALGSAARVFAVEIDGSAPLTAAYAGNGPTSIVPRRTFIDGIGGNGVSPAIWPMARELLAGVMTVTVAEVAAAIRLLAERNHVVAEGAGAAPVAASIRGVAGAHNVVAVVSGGNIDRNVLAAILRGDVP